MLYSCNLAWMFVSMHGVDVITEGSECVNTPGNRGPWDTRSRVAYTNAVLFGT